MGKINDEERSDIDSDTQKFASKLILINHLEMHSEVESIIPENR